MRRGGTMSGGKKESREGEPGLQAERKVGTRRAAKAGALPRRTAARGTETCLSREEGGLRRAGGKYPTPR